jgi:hypothetical protein
MKRIVNKYFLKYKKLIVKFSKLSVLFISFTMFYSCSSSDPYPAEWGDVYDTQKHGDSVISGNYRINGEATAKSRGIFTITRLIELPGLSKITSDYDNISIKLVNDETLSIILRAKTDTIYKTIFPDNGLDFSLTDDGLKLNPRKSSGGDPGFVLTLMSGGKLSLMKNTDGSLIVKANYNAVGLFFMIPVYGSTTGWYKFQEYKIN